MYNNRCLLSLYLASLGPVLSGISLAQTLTNLHNFDFTADGGKPIAALIVSGNALYGTANRGGSSHYGTAFALNTDNSVFTTLHSFSESLFWDGAEWLFDGANPSAGLVASGNTLYGTTTF